MAIELLNRLIMFVALWLAQVLILNRIHLFDVATPLLYVFFVITFRRSSPKWQILLWCFALGLLIDVFSNTPGLAAASLTVIAAIQPYYLELYVPRDSADNLQPSLRALGPLKYTYYVLPLVLVYCLLFYTLEMLSFSNVLYWLLCVVSSTALTLLLIFTVEIGKRD